MPSEIRITAAIPCGDDQLSQAKILIGLDAARIAFDTAIKEVTKTEVTIDMRAVRHKAATDRVSSSDAGHG